MRDTRRIIFLVYEGFELLDLTGPASVFSTASADSPRYQVDVISAAGGLVNSFSKISVDTRAASSVRFGANDTLLVVGALPKYQEPAMADAQTQILLRRASKRVARYGSVCTGAFLLAAAGLLDGKRISTHWLGADILAQSFEAVTVEADALYVVDDGLWTSAGVTTGMDMALAMLEADHGTHLMTAVAKGLVMYRRRPGHQSQFSALIDAQSASSGQFAELVDWIEDSLDQPLRVSELAEQSHMSERTFCRKFSATLGMTPSKYIETRRLEHAKNYLEAGMSVKRVCASVGFQSPSAFRKAFKARYGVLPSLHASLHG